jgi:hypothetical protein
VLFTQAKDFLDGALEGGMTLLLCGQVGAIQSDGVMAQATPDSLLGLLELWVERQGLHTGVGKGIGFACAKDLFYTGIELAVEKTSLPLRR